MSSTVQSLTETGVDFECKLDWLSYNPNQHWHCAIQSYWKILEYSNENKHTGTFIKILKFSLELQVSKQVKSKNDFYSS